MMLQMSMCILHFVLLSAYDVSVNLTLTLRRKPMWDQTDHLKKANSVLWKENSKDWIKVIRHSFMLSPTPLET